MLPLGYLFMITYHTFAEPAMIPVGTATTATAVIAKIMAQSDQEKKR